MAQTLTWQQAMEAMPVHLCTTQPLQVLSSVQAAVLSTLQDVPMDSPLQNQPAINVWFLEGSQFLLVKPATAPKSQTERMFL